MNDLNRNKRFLQGQRCHNARSARIGSKGRAFISVVSLLGAIVFIGVLLASPELGMQKAVAVGPFPDVDLTLKPLNLPAEDRSSQPIPPEPVTRLVASLEQTIKSQEADSITIPAPRARFANSGLTPLKLDLRADNQLVIDRFPDIRSKLANQLVGLGNSSHLVFFSVDGQLQAYLEQLVKSARTPHVAAVVINPKTGAIQALAQRSSSVKNLLLHTGMPAASLIKVVTTAAALETSTMSPAQLFRFRGGTYTLNKWNYKSDRRDNRIMSVTEALGRSCNPIFSRVALSFLSPPTLTDYVAKFGFNTNLKFDLPLPESPAVVPNGEYEFGRTAAGFGDVYISPIHAAAFVGALANHGEMQRPYLVEKVLSANGERLYEAAPQSLGQTVDPHTARTLLNMMEATTTKGTSRGEFFINSRPRLPGVRVAAKTGTLNGGNPSGMTHWFVAAAPLENPTIALAILTIDAGRAATPPARIGRMILEHLKKRKAL